uniref:Uncharacterized protein n=1 Tax=viral metagenome TaxID=1070528 RepID=A0A6C0H2T1_9ZZZZ
MAEMVIDTIQGTVDVGVGGISTLVGNKLCQLIDEKKEEIWTKGIDVALTKFDEDPEFNKRMIQKIVDAVTENIKNVAGSNIQETEAVVGESNGGEPGAAPSDATTNSAQTTPISGADALNATTALAANPDAAAAALDATKALTANPDAAAAALGATNALAANPDAAAAALDATKALTANPDAAAAALGSFIPGMTKGGKSKKRTHKFTSKKIRFKLPRKSKKTRR